MNSRQRFGLAGAVVAVAAAAGVVAAPDLPARMAVHWNAAGTPDGTLSKPLALALLPGATTLLLAALYVLPGAVSSGEAIESFRVSYDWLAVAIATTLSVVHVGVVAYNLGTRFPFLSLVFLAVAGLLYVAGTVLERVEQNRFAGIRTPWTLASEEVWDRTHAVGAPLVKLTALSTLLGAVFTEYALVLLFGPLLLTLVVTVGYSYRLSRRLDET